MAMSDDAPQSKRNREAVLSTSMHVLNRPPLPNASPLPKNFIRTFQSPMSADDSFSFECEILRKLSAGDWQGASPGVLVLRCGALFHGSLHESQFEHGQPQNFDYAPPLRPQSNTISANA